MASTISTSKPQPNLTLQAFMREADIQTKDLAALVGVCQGTIQNARTGRTRTTLEVACRIAWTLQAILGRTIGVYGIFDPRDIVERDVDLNPSLTLNEWRATKGLTPVPSSVQDEHDAQCPTDQFVASLLREGNEIQPDEAIFEIAGNNDLPSDKVLYDAPAEQLIEQPFKAAETQTYADVDVDLEPGMSLVFPGGASFTCNKGGAFLGIVPLGSRLQLIAPDGNQIGHFVVGAA